MPDTAALRSLLAAGTPGPWRVAMHPSRKDEVEFIETTTGDWTTIVQSSGAYCEDIDPPCEPADAALIVAAVNALPALLDRLDALEAAAVTYLEAVDAYLDPDNQFTDSRRRTVFRADAALRAALGEPR